MAPPPDAGQGGEGAHAAQWRRLHRITPLLNAWKVGAAIFFIALFQAQEFMADLREAFPAVALFGVIVGLLVVGFLVGLLFGYLAWLRTTYGVSQESIFLHKGILFRQQRHVRLDRVQAVEVTQPLLARIFGFAAVKVESAGGAGSNLPIAYLTEPDAQQLRNELLARAAGEVDRPSAPTAPDGQVAAPAPAPERPIAALGPGRLVGSLALSFSVVLIVLVLVGIIVGAIVTRTPGLVAGTIAPLLGAGAYLWGRFAGEFAFRVGVSPEGIRLRQGLLETKARTVPPGRVQAVQISQPLPWRTKDWWRLQVNIAGYGPTETTGTVLYPVATRYEVAFLLSLVLPDLGDERPLPVLHNGMDGVGTAEGYTTSPRRARWLDPLTWRRTAFRVTNTAILMRTGRWWRSLIVVPHERMQSMGLTQGPVERAMRLAAFVVHSTPGPVAPQVHHLDLDTARTLLQNQAERARQARRNMGPEQWLSNSANQGTGVRRAYAGILPSRPGPPPPSDPSGYTPAGPPGHAPADPPGHAPAASGHAVAHPHGQAASGGTPHG